MKHLNTLALSLMLAPALLHAQSPDLMNYQAAARDGGGNILANSGLTVRFTVRQGSATGTNVYRETHAVTTNAFGVFNAQVGGGTVVNGSIAGIAWGTGSYWLQVEANPGGGYVDLGAQQLVSVPYAKYAESSGSGSTGWGLNGNSGTDPNTDFIGTSDAQPLVFKVAGVEAGRIDLVGTGNTSLGANAMLDNTSGTVNSAFGANALTSNTTGGNNTAVGGYAGRYNSSGSSNTSVGQAALSFNTTGNDNTAIGTGALYANMASGNTAIGSLALAANGSASGNTAVGYRSLFTNTTGYGNSALGENALEFSNGDENTAIGSEALRLNTTGQGNCGVGALTLRYNTTGSHNTAIGQFALLNNTTGTHNVGLGRQALMFNSIGSFNVAIGNDALKNATGGENVAIGDQAQSENTSGYFNTAIGNLALSDNVTGDDNVAVGWGSGTTASFTNTISIGNYGYLNAFSDQAFIGNLSTTWNGGNVTWSTFSDARVKRDVGDGVHGLDFITRLRPVTYHRDIDRHAELTGNKPTRDYPEKYDIEKILFSGFLAQEVEQAAKETGYDFSGLHLPKSDKEVYSLSYETFVVPLVKAVQELAVMVDELQARDEERRSEIVRLRSLVETLSTQRP
ncbi:MAG TPA: tail fiber domain-containing protein [Flavobacteriales bacterium]|nr:tail fiber domain-containing protein [Flavobacteriales bacterium]